MDRGYGGVRACGIYGVRWGVGYRRRWGVEGEGGGGVGGDGKNPVSLLLGYQGPYQEPRLRGHPRACFAGLENAGQAIERSVVEHAVMSGMEAICRVGGSNGKSE